MQAGAAPIWKDLDVNQDQTAELAELIKYYRSRGVGDITVATARVTAASILHTTLMHRIDADHDGRLSERELDNLHASLSDLDDNEDGLIGPGELASEVERYPGVTGTMLVEHLPVPGSTTTRDGLFIGGSPTAANVAKSGEISVDAADDHDARRWQFSLRLGTIWNVRCDRGRLGEQSELAMKNAKSWLQQLDRDRNGIVTFVEVPAAETTQFRDWLHMADRNGDGNLALTERQEWLDLQCSFARAHTLLTVLDFGRGLFEFIDADHDGGLSDGECRSARARLDGADCLVDGVLTEAQLPRCLLAIIGNGHPRSALLSAGSTGPAWFRAMDRNADGAVTRGEFLGTHASFHHLDQNADETLTSDEAGAAR